MNRSDVEAAAQALHASLHDLHEVAGHARLAVGRQLADTPAGAERIDAGLVGTSIRAAAWTAVLATLTLRRVQRLLAGDPPEEFEARLVLIEISTHKLLERVRMGEGAAHLGHIDALAKHLAALRGELVESPADEGGAS